MANPLGTPSTPVVVTGGASGIGRASALALAEAGRAVAIWDIDEAGAGKTAAECGERFDIATFSTHLDVRDRGAIEAAAAATVDALGPVGGFVHAAGIVRPALEDIVDSDTWDDVLTVNLRAHADIVRTLLPSLRAARPGSAIVGIASIEGIIGHGAIPSYTASKHGLVGLTRSFAHRLGPEGIRANAVLPGYVDTPMLAPTVADPATRHGMEDSVPLKRLATPEDIGRVVRFLLSDEAAYVHGAAIVVDGGMTAAGGQK
jgi:NAD(P)-dependent dehydrogenase (short-subunit alcohol dehydrogenase family)